jgi:hypothetical protein
MLFVSVVDPAEGELPEARDFSESASDTALAAGNARTARGLTGAPSHAVCSGKVSPFIKRERQPNCAPSPILEPGKQTEYGFRVARFPMVMRPIFMMRSSKR